MSEATKEAIEPQADDDEPELTGPERLCALSRVVRPVGELIRFGAGLDGIVVPDLNRKLPGRGVWVACCKQVVAEAVRRNVFARSLKRQVTAPADLPDRIEQMMVKRLVEALALANKAGLVTTGFVGVDTAIDAGPLAAIVHGHDAATDGVTRLDRKFAAVMAARGEMGSVVSELGIDQISLAIGRSNVVHAAIKPGGAATRLLEEAGRLKRFRSPPAAS